MHVRKQTNDIKHYAGLQHEICKTLNNMQQDTKQNDKLSLYVHTS